MTGAKFVQTLVFGWWDNPDATHEQLAKTATGLGVPIPAQGFDNRFTAKAANCLKQTLEDAVQPAQNQTEFVSTPARVWRGGVSLMRMGKT